MSRRFLGRRAELDELAAASAGVLPLAMIQKVLALGLTRRHLALCLHRVAGPSNPEGRLAVRAEVLDRLIDLLLGTRQGDPSGWLSVTFDDGYDDAAAYIASRAPRFPQVEFLFFVCPEKVERRAGFRWDLREPPDDAAPFLPTEENASPALRTLGDAPATRLVDREALRALQALPNVALGNHTNLHARAVELPLEVVREDYRRSTEQFEALGLGAPLHFAFPFGTPGHDFDARHVALLRELGDFTLWTTEARPALATERAAGAVLPRCPILGLRSVPELASWLAARVLRDRLHPRRSLSELARGPQR